MLIELFFLPTRNKNSLPIIHFVFYFPQKRGKWCGMHVHIAWQVYNHQQKIKVSSNQAMVHFQDVEYI